MLHHKRTDPYRKIMLIELTGSALGLANSKLAKLAGEEGTATTAAPAAPTTPAVAAPVGGMLEGVTPALFGSWTNAVHCQIQAI